MKIILLLTILICLIPRLSTASDMASSQTPPQVNNKNLSKQNNPWLPKLALVKIGMNRSAIEKLLPHKNSHSGSMEYFAAYQTFSYWLDENWRVKIIYDYTGALRSKKGAIVNAFSPHNKLLALPKIEAGVEPSDSPAAPLKIPSATSP